MNYKKFHMRQKDMMKIDITWKNFFQFLVIIYNSLGYVITDEDILFQKFFLLVIDY